MNRISRKAFLCGTLAMGAVGCQTASTAAKGRGGRMLFGCCVYDDDTVKSLADLGYDFYDTSVGGAFDPDRDDEWWKRQKETLLSRPLPLRSCAGFIPGKYRLTGPRADHEPALRYAETVMRRAEEIGVKYIVFGSGGARNVPGDFTRDHKERPDLEGGERQYADFCRELARRVADLQTATVVIEPLRPNESNIINFVRQGIRICREVNSPRVQQLADLFHMQMAGEDAHAIVEAGELLKHCHIAEYSSRRAPGADPALSERLVPYFEALKTIGYTGGISIEGDIWFGDAMERNLERALELMRRLSA